MLMYLETLLCLLYGMVLLTEKGTLECEMNTILSSETLAWSSDLM